MTHMRRGFTMIELIFVIVIIGILAAVAIPKLAGVQGQAQASKIVAYAGTLNRTTLPPYWSESIMAGTSGSVTAYKAKILNDLARPTDFGGDPDFSTNMNANGSFQNFAGGTITGNTMQSATINGVTYSLVCNDGNTTVAPACDVFNSQTGKFMLHSNL